MQGYDDLFSSEPAQPPHRRQHRPVRMGIAAVLLAFGGLLTRLAMFANGLAHRLAGDATVRTLTGATRAFRSAQGQTDRLTGWEQTLLRVGPPVLLSIGGALALLWLLVLVGGALAWLALHGYGFALMLGAVLVGVLIGFWRARLSARMPEQDGLN